MPSRALAQRGPPRQAAAQGLCLPGAGSPRRQNGLWSSDPRRGGRRVRNDQGGSRHGEHGCPWFRLSSENTAWDLPGGGASRPPCEAGHLPPVQISGSRSEPTVMKGREVFSPGARVLRLAMFSLTAMLPEKVSAGPRVLPRGRSLGSRRWGVRGGSTLLWSPATGQGPTLCFRNQTSTCMHTRTHTHVLRMPPKSMAGRPGCRWYKVIRRPGPQSGGVGTEPPGPSAKRHVPGLPAPGGDGPPGTGVSGPTVPHSRASLDSVVTAPLRPVGQARPSGRPGPRGPSILAPQHARNPGSHSTCYPGRETTCSLTPRSQHGTQTEVPPHPSELPPRRGRASRTGPSSQGMALTVTPAGTTPPQPPPQGLAQPARVTGEEKAEQNSEQNSEPLPLSR